MLYFWAVRSRAVPLVVRLIKVEENQVRTVGIRHRQPLHCFVYTSSVWYTPESVYTLTLNITLKILTISHDSLPKFIKVAVS